MERNMFDKEIRELSQKLLKDKKVDCIVGYRKTEIPYLNRLVVIENEDEIDSLIFDYFCRYPSPTILPKLKGKKIAIIAKGCDSRAINLLISEKQIERKDLYIIGVECQGVIDPQKIRKIMPDTSSINIQNEKVILDNGNKKEEYSLNELLCESCKRCNYPTPIEYDILLGENRNKQKRDYTHLLDDFEAKDNKQRWELTRDEFSKCIRCYACRQICPLCYCNECFVDCNNPNWLDKGLAESDLIFWNIGRLYHMAGRCVDCGACSSVCPVGIQFDKYLLSLERTSAERFDFIPGLNNTQLPPLQTYKTEDSQEFIL